MGFRKVVVKESAAENIAKISWYLESEGFLATAEKFSDDAYDFLSKLGDSRRGYRLCRDPERNLIGYKCIQYRKKYTVVFIEMDEEIIISEFMPSKQI